MKSQVHGTFIYNPNRKSLVHVTWSQSKEFLCFKYPNKKGSCILISQWKEFLCFKYPNQTSSWVSNCVENVYHSTYSEFSVSKCAVVVSYSVVWHKTTYDQSVLSEGLLTSCCMHCFYEAYPTRIASLCRHAAFCGAAARGVQPSCPPQWPSRWGAPRCGGA